MSEGEADSEIGGFPCQRLCLGFLVLFGANRMPPEQPESFLTRVPPVSSSITCFSHVTPDSWKHVPCPQPLLRVSCLLKSTLDNMNWRSSQWPPWKSTWHVKIVTRKSQAPEGSWVSKAGWIPWPSSPATWTLNILTFPSLPQRTIVSNDMNRWCLTKALFPDPSHIVENARVVIYSSPLRRFCRKRNSLWTSLRRPLRLGKLEMCLTGS